MPVWCAEARTQPAFITAVFTGVTAWRSVSTPFEYQCQSCEPCVRKLCGYFTRKISADRFYPRWHIYCFMAVFCFFLKKGPNSETSLCPLFKLSTIEATLCVQSLGRFPGNSYPKWLLSDWVFTWHRYTLADRKQKPPHKETTSPLSLSCTHWNGFFFKKKNLFMLAKLIWVALTKGKTHR